MLFAYIGGLIILAVSAIITIMSTRYSGDVRLAGLLLNSYLAWLLIYGMRHLH